MLNFADKIDSRIFRIIAEACAHSGVSGFVIGGFVRDLLIGRVSKDVDIVVLGSGIKIARQVSEKIPFYIFCAIYQIVQRNVPCFKQNEICFDILLHVLSSIDKSIYIYGIRY